MRNVADAHGLQSLTLIGLITAFSADQPEFLVKLENMIALRKVPHHFDSQGETVTYRVKTRAAIDYPSITAQHSAPALTAVLGVFLTCSLSQDNDLSMMLQVFQDHAIAISHFPCLSFGLIAVHVQRCRCTWAAIISSAYARTGRGQSFQPPIQR